MTLKSWLRKIFVADLSRRSEFSLLKILSNSICNASVFPSFALTLNVDAIPDWVRPRDPTHKRYKSETRDKGDVTTLSVVVSVNTF